MEVYDQNKSAQDALGKLRIASAQAYAAQRIAQRDYAKAQVELDKWEQEYQLATF